MPRLDPITVREIFSDAVALPAAQRKRFLDQACGGDSGLRARVQSLLDALANDEQFLAAPTVDPHGGNGNAAVGSSGNQIDETIGTVLGPYKLLERLGEGGFGTVYLAEQNEPVRRTVAVKVIKLGMDTRQVIARFEAERQALAMMDHPHIARVYDAGTTQTGRPYFVMELVKGLPITQYCDQHRVPLRERLSLFIDVCHAVQHAHQKGIIHRDLKPSNVLVSRHDDKPVVKVIDFGIVKATGERLTNKTLHTEWRQLIGTPTYMSPEQAGLSDLDIDTRCDIYSLGVLLYELLTGSTPFDADQLCRAGGDELRRIIREVEPPKPSTRLSSLSTSRKGANGQTGKRDVPLSDSSRAIDASMPRFHAGKSTSDSSAAATIASFRRTDPPGLTRALRGELDWIVMKCLEKNRARRYETASSLALDVNRHLAGEPVIAAPPSRLYRLSKTLRRHRTAAAVTAGFIVLIAAGLLGMGSLWRHAAQARDAESDQRARAEVINRFLTDMLTAADPAKARGAKLTVRESLDMAAKRIEEGAVGNQPRVEAEIRFTIGSTYLSLGLFPEAETQLRAADALQTRMLGDEHADTLRTRTKLAETLWYKSDYAGVAAIAEPTLEAQRRILGADDPDTLKSQVLLGRVLWVKPGRYFEAESLLRSAIERLEKVRGHDHADTAAALDGLGEAYSFNSYREKAEALHREALRINTKCLGEEHPATLYSMFYLAHTLDARSREKMHRRVYELRLRVLGPDHVDTLASQQAVACALLGQSRFAEAEPLLRESLAAHLRIAPNYVNTIHGHHFLAWCLEKQQKFQEAEALVRQGLEAARKQFGPEDPDTTIRMMCKLAQLLATVNKDTEAEQVAREVLAIQRRQMPRPAPEELTQSSLALVKVLKRRGAAQEAMQVERELIDFWLAEANAPDAGATTIDGAARRLLNPEIEALRDPSQAVQFALQANQRSNRQNPLFLKTLAQAHLYSGDVSQAINTFEEVLRLLENDESRAEMLNDAAWGMLTVVPEPHRDTKAALDIALRGNALSKNKNSDHLDTLALAYFRLGDTANAIKSQKAALDSLPADASSRAGFEARLTEYENALKKRDEGDRK